MSDRWYTVRFGIQAPEGLTASKLDMMLYKVTKHSGLSFNVEEIISVTEVEEED